MTPSPPDTPAAVLDFPDDCPEPGRAFFTNPVEVVTAYTHEEVRPALRRVERAAVDFVDKARGVPILAHRLRLIADSVTKPAEPETLFVARPLTEPNSFTPGVEGPAYTFTTGAVAPAGNVVLFFRAVNNRGIVDNARVDATAVPEPAAAGLAAVAGLGLLARRRRRA